MCMSMVMSLGFGVGTLHQSLIYGPLKSSTFNHQFLKEVPREDQGGSGREDAPEYSTAKQKLSSEKPKQEKCDIRRTGSEEITKLW